MQIFPSLFFSKQAADIANTNNNPVSLDFASFLKQAESKVNPLIPEKKDEPGEENSSLLLKKIEQVKPQLEKPLKEEEFSQVENLLLEAGVSKEKISLFKEKLKKGSLTLKELLVGLGLLVLPNQNQQIKLSSAEEKELLSLLKKMKFNESESKQLVSFLKKGEVEKFTQSLLAKINTLPKESKVEISLEEIKALSKAVGESFSFKKLANFVGENSLPSLKNLFLTLNQEIKKSFNLGKVLSELDDNAKNLLKNILSLFTQKDLDKEQSTVSYIKAKVEEGKVKKVEDGNSSTNKDEKTKEKEKIIKVQEQATSESREEKKGKNSLDLELKEKSSVEDTFQSKKKVSSKLKVESTKFEVLSNASTTNNAETRLVLSPKISKQVWTQVEQAIWQNINKNSSKMVLRLNPPDLGKVGMVLQVNKGEVSLLLKTNNDEVGQVLNQNLHSLKAHLEQEGFRVQKMEVKTGLERDSLGSFNEQGNNFAESSFEKRENLERGISLARLRSFFSYSGEERKGTEEVKGFLNKEGRLSLFA